MARVLRFMFGLAGVLALVGAVAFAISDRSAGAEQLFLAAAGCGILWAVLYMAQEAIESVMGVIWWVLLIWYVLPYLLFRARLEESYPNVARINGIVDSHRTVILGYIIVYLICWAFTSMQPTGRSPTGHYPEDDYEERVNLRPNPFRDIAHQPDLLDQHAPGSLESPQAQAKPENMMARRQRARQIKRLWEQQRYEEAYDRLLPGEQLDRHGNLLD